LSGTVSTSGTGNCDGSGNDTITAALPPGSYALGVAQTGAGGDGTTFTVT
jgi:hypothetical protein